MRLERTWIAAICLVVLAFGWTALAGGTLRVAEDRLPRGLNPLFAEQLVDLRVDALVFSGLFAEDRFNRVVPVLAESLTMDPSDPRTIEVRLKRDLRWHDGRPLTAADIRFTVETMRDPAVGSAVAGQVRHILEVKVLAPDRLRLTFDYAPRDAGRLLTFPILPAHGFGKEKAARLHPFRLRPVGAGPFRVEQYGTDGSLALSRNTTFALGRPELARVELREMPDKPTQMLLLTMGSLEVVVRVLPRDLPDLEHSRRIELRPYQTNSWWYLGFNLTRRPWSDPAVRQAISQLLDIDHLLEPLGGGERISGPFVPSSPFYNHQKTVPRNAYAPKEAQRLLEKAGYRRDGSSRYQRDGKPLQLELVVEGAHRVAKDIAVAVEGQLKTAGIDVKLTFLDQAGWYEQVYRGKGFDLALSQWSFDRSEDIFDQFHSTGPQNFIGFRDEQVDRLLERARQSYDPQARRDALQEVHLRLAQTRPYIFLWTLTQYAAFASNVREVAIDPFSFYSQVHRWTMGPARRSE